jgi:hypothetical protein
MLERSDDWGGILPPLKISPFVGMNKKKYIFAALLKHKG